MREEKKAAIITTSTSASTPADENCTALVSHVSETKHSFDFSNACVLDTEQYLGRRLLMESLQIYCHDTVNKRRDIEKISQTYASVLKQEKERKTKNQRTKNRQNTDHTNTNTQHQQ